MLPQPALSKGSLAKFAQQVYGPEFYSSMSLGSASAVMTDARGAWNATLDKAVKVGYK
jgi:hypothetical protein